MIKKKILVCFWGQDKESQYLKNSPFMNHDYYEEKKIDLLDLIENYKNIFFNFDLDFLWSTWDRCNYEKYEEYFNYLLINKEPENFEKFLNEIDFPYVGQIRNDDRYKSNRQGYYSQFLHKNTILSYLKKKKFEQYIGLILCRTDIYMIPKNLVQFDFNSEKIYLPEIYWGSRGIGVNDHIIIGNYNYTRKSIDFQKIEELYPIIYNSHNIEQVNHTLLINNNSNFEEFSCEKYCRFPLHMS